MTSVTKAVRPILLSAALVVFTAGTGSAQQGGAGLNNSGTGTTTDARGNTANDFSWGWLGLAGLIGLGGLLGANRNRSSYGTANTAGSASR